MNREIQRAIILWLNNVRLSDICMLPQLETLINHGIMVELEPLPITGAQAQQYQALSGRSPKNFGFFDTLVPACHLARSNINGYTVVEEYAGRGPVPKMLPDLLGTAGWSVQYEETSLAELGQLSLAQDVPTSPTCKIFKCVVETDAQLMAPMLEKAVQAAHSWVGETGLCVLLSETQPANVQHFVNMNNFLADMGVIERNERDGSINWSASLAYYAGHGQLWINLLGRDPEGVVHPQDEYEEVRDTLVKALPDKLHDPNTGASVVDCVYRKEDLYTGDYLFCAPDLVVVFKPGYAPSPHSTYGGFDTTTFTVPMTGTTVMAGAHPSCMKGFLLATAPSLASQVSTSGPLLAVAPTLLHALGIEYKDMDATAIHAAFSPTYLATHPIPNNVHGQDLSEEDEELVINRLRDLGYL